MLLRRLWPEGAPSTAMRSGRTPGASAAPVRPYSALRFVQRELPGAHSIPPTLADFQSQGVAGAWEIDQS